MKRTQRIAVDVGGTFTDFMIFDEADGSVRTGKVPSNDANPMLGVMDGVRALGIDLKQVQTFSHGTTVATNALITRSYPRTAMVCTAGFRDVLEIRDGTKNELWDAYKDIAPPLIQRRDRYEVTERVDASGTIVTELDKGAARALAKELKAKGYVSIAICFINSYLNASNEDAMAEIVAEAYPDALVTRSAAVLPELFEYPRFNTAAANACLAPTVTKYVEELSNALDKQGYSGDLLILHSGGGTMTANAVAQYPVRLAGSGTAAGAIAAQAIGAMCNEPNVIGFDMGGTSTDVSLVHQGALRITKEWSITYGFPITFPSIELVTIGAGGGSIAWLDSAGILHNGPQSAGAQPGPVCYKTGGNLTTNTDANLVLGRLGKVLAGGVLKLDVEASKEALKKLGNSLGTDVTETAAAVLRIANANLADAVRLISTRRGLDPREFALVAFGGAGALHAAFVAKDLSIPRVLVPRYPGVNSAFGCLLGDITHDFARMYQRPLDEVKAADVAALYEEMIKEGTELLSRADIEASSITIERTVSMRYTGQWRSLLVPVNEGENDLVEAGRRFHELHKQEFAYSRDDVQVEVYQVSIKVIGKVPTPKLKEYPRVEGEAAKPSGVREVWFEDAGWVEVPVYQRTNLKNGMNFHGPAIVDQLDSTTVVPPWASISVDARLNMIMTIEGAMK